MNTIGNINKHGIRAQGRKELVKHLKGEKITRSQAIKAKCYDCMGYYNGGAEDCRITECSLYPYFPYRQEITDEE